MRLQFDEQTTANDEQHYTCALQRAPISFVWRRGFNIVRRTAIVCLLVLLAGCKGRGTNDQQYQTAEVDRGNVIETVTATGTLSAVTTVQVGSQVSGVISRLYADFNSHVKKGQLLAELDPTPFQAQVEQRQADLTKAKVEVANAKINYDRQVRLAKAGLAPQADVDNTRAQYQGAAAQVQQSTAALSQALTNLRYTQIISPIDGVVVDRAYDVGQTVAASFQAPTLFQIAQDLTKMQVQADVDQSDIGRVQVGQLARFSVDAYPDEEFRGRIAQIRLNATINQNVVSYPVILEVPNPQERLRPKMTANVTINVAMVRDVLRVPNAALRFKPPDAAPSKESPQTASAPPQRAANDTAGAPTSTTGTTGGGSFERRMQRMGQRRGGFGGAAGGFGDAIQSQQRAPKKTQTVYLMDADKKLQPVQIRTGISDGRFTEVVDGTIKPGDTIVVGLATSKVEGPAAFGGGMGGGPGRPGGGGPPQRGR
jgi:HlyD family secretion protein